ncbi:MAG: signal peptide peptidase SppA [Planctomycetota bacterium]
MTAGNENDYRAEPAPGQSVTPEAPVSHNNTAAAQAIPVRKKQTKFGVFRFLYSMITGFFMATGFGVVVLFLLFCILIYSAASKTSDMKFPQQEQLTEKVVRKGSKQKILVVDLNGIIIGSGSHVSSSGTIEPLIKQLRYAADTSYIKAVVLQVSSGGGGLTASDILYHEIQNIQEKGKKVIAVIGDMAASGAYYTIAPADYIVISPTGMTGSFGVIMNRMNFKELMKKIGIAPEPLMSTNMKDIGSPFRDLSEEEKKYFNDILKVYHKRFVKIIAEGRKISVNKVKELATGKLFTAEESVALKLADEIGYFDTALAKAEELTGLKNPAVIRYKDKYPWMKFLDMETKSLIDEEELARSFVKILREYSNKVEIEAK